MDFFYNYRNIIALVKSLKIQGTGVQKWFVFFLLVFCSNQVLALFKKEESSYCLESELNLLHGIKGKKLSVLKKNKR